jgi:hypothetical protein
MLRGDGGRVIYYIVFVVRGRRNDEKPTAAVEDYVLWV